MYLDLRHQTTRAITELPARIFRRGLILRFTTLIMLELDAYQNPTLRAPSTVCRPGHLATSYRATTRLDVLTKPSTFAFDRAVPTPSHVHTKSADTVRYSADEHRTPHTVSSTDRAHTSRHPLIAAKHAKDEAPSIDHDQSPLLKRCPVPSVHAVPCPHRHRHRRNRFSSTPRPSRPPVPHIGSNASDTLAREPIYTDSRASYNRSFPSRIRPTNPSEIVRASLQSRIGAWSRPHPTDPISSSNRRASNVFRPDDAVSAPNP